MVREAKSLRVPVLVRKTVKVVSEEHALNRIEMSNVPAERFA
jgi:hypothetical protein